MSYTLLRLTQLLLSAMDSDEVNSIYDTTESTQVVNIIDTVYRDIVARADLPAHYTLFSLEASGDNTQPTLMTLPDGVSSLKWIKYNTETEDDTDDAFTLLRPLTVEQFLQKTDGLSESADNVASMTFAMDLGSVKFLYRNDGPPTCYTCPDANTVFFDSYDNTVDTTLQSSKTKCYGLYPPTLILSDSTIPDLSPAQFSLLLNEAKALAFAELKQTQHVKAEQNSRRGWVRLQSTKDRVKGRSFFDLLPNYGRK